MGTRQQPGWRYGRSSILERGKEYISSPKLQHLFGGLPSLLISGNRGLFSRMKRPTREADNSPPISEEVTNIWRYTSISLYAFMAWCLIKRRNTFCYFITQNEE